MNKKVLSLGILLTSMSPTLSLISCARNEKLRTDLRKHEYLINKNIQDSARRLHLDFSKIERKNIDDFAVAINSQYETPMAASGYGETRKFYKTKDPLQMHTGIDLFVNQGEKILAPSGTEIIASYWIYQKNEWASGIGGGLALRLKISDLNIPSALKEYVYVKKSKKYFRVPKLSFSKNGKYRQIKITGLEFVTKKDYHDFLSTIKNPNERIKLEKDSDYIYVGIIHLSQESPKFISRNIKNFSHSSFNFKVAMDIDIDNPKKIKKGEIIGLVGSPLENGGWAPHIDINTYSILSDKVQKRWFKYKNNNLLDNKKMFYKIASSVWQKGIKNGQKATRENNILKLKSEGNFDPNEIFNFYQDDDKQVTVEKI